MHDDITSRIYRTSQQWMCCLWYHDWQPTSQEPAQVQSTKREQQTTQLEMYPMDPKILVWSCLMPHKWLVDTTADVSRRCLGMPLWTLWTSLKHCAHVRFLKAGHPGIGCCELTPEGLHLSVVNKFTESNFQACLIKVDLLLGPYVWCRFCGGPT